MSDTLFPMDAYTVPTKTAVDKKKKRNWENAFQRWSNKEFEDGSSPEGCCGYGAICDWCEDNSYGRPCIRAFNAMCREKKIVPDYTDYDFQKWWYWSGND